MIGDRLQGELVFRLPFGRTPEVRHQHDSGIRLQRRLDRRQGGPDASIARHYPVSDGDIQVFANENAFARQFTSDIL